MFKRKVKKAGNSIGSSVALLSVSRVLTYVIIMVASMLLSRFRTLEEYGTYSQIIMVVNLFTSLLMLGLPNCINYYLAQAENQEERNRFLSVYYILNTILSFIVGAVLVACVPLLELYFKNPAISIFAYFIALFPWTKIITSSIENLLIVHKRSKALVAYRIIHSLSVLGNILVVKYLSLGFEAYVLLYLIFEILFTFFVYLFAIKLDGMFKFKIDWQMVKKILVFSVPLGLSTAAGTLKAEMDKFVIGFYFSTEEYAIYANAAKEIPVTFIASSITAVLLPIIARKTKNNNIDGAVDLWNNTTVIGYLINAFFAFGLITFSTEAMSFLYSEKYVTGAAVFAIYSVLLLFRSTYFGMILQSIGNTKLIFKSSVVSLILNVVLNFILYYLIGFEGPAIATIIATAWSAGYLLWNTHKAINKPFKEIFPWKKVFQITIVNVILSITVTVLDKLIPLEVYIGNIAEALVLMAVWFAIYVLIYGKMFKKELKRINSQE